jgi:hypothetical protein
VQRLATSIVHATVHGYRRRHGLVAWLLVVVIVLGEIVPVRGVQIAAISVLLVLVLELLTDVHDKVEARRNTWFESFNASAADAAAEVRRRLERNRRVRLRSIGVTMEAGWPFVQNLMLEAFRSGARLDAMVAFLDPEWLPADSSTVRKRALTSATSVQEFLSDNAAALERTGSRCAAYGYRHRPTWHGLLIDDDTLYWSPCAPKDFGLSGPQAGTEVISDMTDPASVARIEAFRAWCDEIAAQPPIATSDPIEAAAQAG